MSDSEDPKGRSTRENILPLPLGEVAERSECPKGRSTRGNILPLPLGELSPQVTERVLQPFSNDKINLCTHITEIPVYIPVGESQNLQTKSHQELRTFRIISKPLRFVMLRAIQFNDQSGRSAIKVHLVWSLVSLSVLAALGHLSQGERQGMLARYKVYRTEALPLSVRQIGVYCSIR